MSNPSDIDNNRNFTKIEHSLQLSVDMSLQTPVVDAMIVSVQPEGSIHVLTEEKILKETNLKLADIELQNIEDLLEPQNAVKPN